MSGPFTFSKGPFLVHYWAGPWDGETVGPMQAGAPVGGPVAVLSSPAPGMTGFYMMAEDPKTFKRRAEWNPGEIMWTEES